MFQKATFIGYLALPILHRRHVSRNTTCSGTTSLGGIRLQHWYCDCDYKRYLMPCEWYTVINTSVSWWSMCAFP